MAEIHHINTALTKCSEELQDLHQRFVRGKITGMYVIAIREDGSTEYLRFGEMPECDLLGATFSN